MKELAGSRAVTWVDGDTTEEEPVAAGVKTEAGSRSALGKATLRSTEKKAEAGAGDASDRVGRSPVGPLIHSVTRLTKPMLLFLPCHYTLTLE